MTSRSPVIFWLLLVATIAVDAVALSWVAGGIYAATVYAVIAFHALVLGQLSIVCIASAINENHRWSRFAPIFAVVAAALLTAIIDDGPDGASGSFVNHLAVYGIHAALLMSALWLLQRTAFWRARSGIAREWRFSVAHLLIAMTVVAVLTTSVGQSPMLGEDLWINVAFMLGSVALAAVCVAIWSLSWHWFLRLAAAMAFALALGMAFEVAASLIGIGDFGWFLSLAVGAHFLLHAIVVSAWLGLAPILPDEGPRSEGAT